jgi:uncharacterized protein HemX
MSDESTGVRASARRNEARRSSGRGLAVFATLVALGALAATLYPQYVRLTSGPPSDSGAIEALRLEQQHQADELKRLADGIASLDERLQNDRRDATVSQPPNASAAIPDRTLKLVEAEYLLQSANDRVKVTGDARDALAMALGAQALVDRIDDPTLASVRAQLSRDVSALRDAAGVDVDATYRRLQTLGKALPDLPARGKRFGAASASDTPAGTSMVWQKFLSLFEFRRSSAAQRPPLGPDDATYLRLNLGLMVQSAELALLRGDGDAYRQNLESVRGWLDDYLDTTASSVGAARAEIEQLLTVRLDRARVDLGGSLAALRALVGPLAPEPSAPTSPQPSASPDAVAHPDPAAATSQAGAGNAP